MEQNLAENVAVEPETLQELQEAETALTKDARELLADYELPLTFQPMDREGPCKAKDADYHTVKTGIFWINGPFKTNFWEKARKKPKKATCTCTCGHKHVPKAQAAPAELKKAA